jgi:hypothetical protein
VLLDFVTVVSVVPAALDACLCNCATERLRVNVVRESPPTVDLHNGYPLPVLSLEMGIAVDGDLAQLEAEVVVRLSDDSPRRLAEMAAGRGVEDDLGYG